MSIKKIIAAAIAGGMLTGAASAQDEGLKDIYADYFKIGTCYQWRNDGLNNETMRNTILREFNSVTHEDDLKPYNTMVQQGSTDTDIKVQLNSGARQVLQFAMNNNIGVRGHALVWHQQTSPWFFRADMQNNNSGKATPEQMDSRMKSYFNNLLALIKQEFPNVNLYAYDVVNEIFLDNGNHRQAETGWNTENSDNSKWVDIYGDNRFADSAFVFAAAARDQHFPNMKLFYNDFNEYHPDGKRAAIVAMANRLGPQGLGVMDGIGMQSHLSTNWPPIATYKTAINAFAGTGLEIHVTELDITIESGSNEAAQATLYKDVFQELMNAKDAGANITSVSVWGVTDDRSWRSDRSPLLFNSNFQKKAAYNEIAKLPSQTVTGPDANGYYFLHNFDGGNDLLGWARRGDNVSVTHTTSQKNSGTGAVSVTNRSYGWHGALLTLDSRHFVSGTEYSFSVMVMSQTAGTISLSYQYDDAAGDEKYGNIGSVDVVPNQWVQIRNTNHVFPPGSNFAIYVEMDPANGSFFFDDVMGGIAGATVNLDGTPGSTSVQHIRTYARGIANPLVSVRGRTLFIDGASNSKVRVRVVNMKGKTVAKHKVEGGASVSLRKLPAGVYMVEAVRVKDKYKDSTRVTLK